jgi:DNA polymerase-3 subunit beta
MPVVPTKAMSLLERNLTDPGETIRVCFRPNEVLFKTETAMIYSRLVEGRFPNYRQVLPQKLSIKVPITVGPFQSAVRQAAIMTDDESKRVVFAFAKKKLTLQARGTESGRSKVELPLEFDGKAIEMSFDPKFVLDMLRILEPDTVLSLEMNDPATPAVFRRDQDYQYVVVPLVTTPPTGKGEGG